MALPTTDIFLRSPYWVNVDVSQLDYVLCELRVWTGDLSAEPTYADAKLRSSAFNNKTSFDIAEFARDYVEVTFQGTGESNAVFISYQLSHYLIGAETDPTPETKVYLTGFDGYGTFQDGVNFQWYKQVLMSDANITAYPETNYFIPVKQNLLTGYKMQTLQPGTTSYHTFNTVSGLTPTENTANMVDVISTSDTGVYADRMVLEYSAGPDELIYIDYQDCSKYGVTQVFFVNRMGATQCMHFSGKFEVSMKAKSETYKRNLLTNGTYSDTRHQKYVLNKNGNISMVLNTGWIDETNNDSIIEMMMSEQVWVIVETDKLGVGWMPKQSTNYVVPVNFESEDVAIKSRVNDKMINYTFKFEAAQDWINNVR